MTDDEDRSTTPRSDGRGGPSGPTSVGRRDVTEWRSGAGRRLAEGHRRLARRVGGRGALVTALVVGGTIAVASAWGATVIYDGVTGRRGIERIDVPALRLAKRVRSPAVNGLAAGIAHGFGPVGMPIAAVLAGTALSVAERSATPITIVAAAGAGSLAMTVAGKDVVHRNRPPRRDAIPPYESSPSFPSGHTLNATTVAGTITYLLLLRQSRPAAQRALIAGSGATVAAVGISRVLLGAHWFSDVAVGWTTGLGWLSTVITAHRLHLTIADPSKQGRTGQEDRRPD